MPPQPPRRRGLYVVLASIVVVIVAAVIGVTVWAASGGGNDEKTVAGATDAYKNMVVLAKKGDFGALYDEFDQNFRSAISKDDFLLLLKCSDDQGSPAGEDLDAEVSDVTIDGNMADVETSDGEHTTLVYEDGHWRLYTAPDDLPTRQMIDLVRSTCDRD